MAVGDGHRLGDQAGSGIGIPVTQAQGQGATEVSIKGTGRAVPDCLEGDTEGVIDGVQGRDT